MNNEHPKGVIPTVFNGMQVQGGQATPTKTSQLNTGLGSY